MNIWMKAAGGMLATMVLAGNLGQAGPPRTDVRAQLAAQGAKVRSVAVVKELHGHTDGVWPVAFSPDGTKLASGSADKTVKIWDVATGKELKTLTGHTSCVTALAFSLDGKYLVTGGFDEHLIAWNTATWKIESNSQQLCPVMHLAFLPGSKLFVSTCGPHLRQWEVGQVEEVREMTADATMDAMAVTKDGEVVTADEKGTVRLWDPSSGSTLMKKSRPKTDTGEENRIVAMTAMKDGDTLVEDMEWIWRWKHETGAMEQVMRRQALGLMSTAALKMRNTQLASLDSDQALMGTVGPIVIIRGKNERGDWVFFNTHQEVGGNDEINSFAVSPSGEYVAVGRGGSLGGSRAPGPHPDHYDVEIFSAASLLNFASKGGSMTTTQSAKRPVLPPVKAPWQE